MREAEEGGDLVVCHNVNVTYPGSILLDRPQCVLELPIVTKPIFIVIKHKIIYFQMCFVALGVYYVVALVVALGVCHVVFLIIVLFPKLLFLEPNRIRSINPCKYNINRSICKFRGC